MQRNLNVCNVPLCHLLVFSLDWVLITFVTPCNKISLKIPAQKLSRIGLKNGNFELYCLEGSSQQENNLSLNGPSNQILNWQESNSKVSFSATLVLRVGKNLKWKWMKTCYYLNIPRNQSVLAILSPHIPEVKWGCLFADRLSHSFIQEWRDLADLPKSEWMKWVSSRRSRFCFGVPERKALCPTLPPLVYMNSGFIDPWKYSTNQWKI